MVLCKFFLFDGDVPLKVIVSLSIVLIPDLSLLDLSIIAVNILLALCYFAIEFLLVLLESLLEVLAFGH
jgi:hypothetical protein